MKPAFKRKLPWQVNQSTRLRGAMWSLFVVAIIGIGIYVARVFEQIYP